MPREAMHILTDAMATPGSIAACSFAGQCTPQKKKQRVSPAREMLQRMLSKTPKHLRSIQACQLANARSGIHLSSYASCMCAPQARSQRAGYGGGKQVRTRRSRQLKRSRQRSHVMCFPRCAMTALRTKCDYSTMAEQPV